MVPFEFNASLSSISKAILPSPHPMSRSLPPPFRVATFVMEFPNEACKSCFVGISEGFILIQFCAGNTGKESFFASMAVNPTIWSSQR